ncbi:restriction endonuclease subunit S [Bacillus velezensis]|uniref:restriction endonuclease subunit S n=1 Tax=Bacillus TaxID=1386 RepID=UPI001BACA74F|nr:MULTISPECIES: restriction endonuclease subunit S [Bacillus]MBT0952647.1 restriction endonuclease subunit S [Bacillus velezensis]MCQ9194722.1 restriction endonuclease subunit S [Bacillus velezensis]MCX2917795.1 restriction endonuclease subunit S [Bacillus velezensis]MCY6276689.1 restriction endonuclease subunit S [Bacillus sp. NEAU-16]MDA3609530.1 restriction endonuclease subunit S [Bacillus sp. NEAU-242-2]
MGNKRVPEVRFEGFSGEWEERKLGDFTESYSGGTPSAGNKLYYGGSIPFIRSAEINSKSTELFITEDGLNNSSAKMVERGDILYALYGATSGEVGIAKIHGAINQAILAIKPKFDDDSYFIMQWLKKQKSTIINTYLQGGQGNLSGSIVKDLIIPLPTNKDEQVKLGDFFKKIDDTIALHQQELTTLKQTKQGFLQKMFPKEGESVPEVRFPGFDGEWEEHKLDSIVDRVKSYSLSRDVETTEYTGYKYIHYGDIHTKVADIIDEFSDLPNIKAGNYELLKKGDLVLADASEDYQGIAAPAVITIDVPYKLVSGLHTIALRPKQIDSLFLYYLINSQTFRKYGYKAGTGMKVFGISATNLLRFESLFPTFEEQTKIGNFFKQLDDTIALHQRELDALKVTKKAFLQKMFV